MRARRAELRESLSGQQGAAAAENSTTAIRAPATTPLCEQDAIDEVA